MSTTVRVLGRDDVDGDAALVTSLADVYHAAFGAPGYDEPRSKADAWASDTLPRHAAYPGFRLVVADGDDGPLGLAYAYTGERGQPWADRLVEALPAPIADEWVGGHLEIVELAVTPEAQGSGVGGRLHDALLADQPHRRALLCTFPDEGRPAPGFYRRRGWQWLATVSPTADLYGHLLAPTDRPPAHRPT